MDAPARLADPRQEALQGGLARQRAVGDGLVDARQLLHHHAAGAEIDMADLGVAHLAGGQADMELRGLQQRARRLRLQRVEHRLARGADRVVGGLARPVAPAIEHDEDDGARRAGRGGVWHAVDRDGVRRRL
jgi:hypothetical protein